MSKGKPQSVTVATTPPGLRPERSGTRWEYAHDFIPRNTFAEVANAHGAEGWELVAAVPRVIHGENGTSGFDCFWKRRT